MSNEIHSTAIIDDNVVFGENNKILPFTIIHGPTRIGNNNIIGPHVVIGSPGSDTRNPRYDSSESEIEIGDNNIIRQFVTIEKPCYRDITRIKSNVYVMANVLIPHDTVLSDDVVVTPMTVFGGISTVLRGANIGLGCSIHQYSIIGHFSFIAMGSTVTKNIKPFSVYTVGKKARVNLYAIKKFGFMDHIDQITKYVIEGIEPHEEELLKMTEEFEKLHLDSKRGLYL